MGKVRGGHAIALVGYDDNKRSRIGHQGAFLLQNSWGKRYGNDGRAWISYKFFMKTMGWGGIFVLYDSDANTLKEDVEEAKKLQPVVEVNASRGQYQDKVVINWTKVEGALNYEVQKKEASASDFYKLGYARNNFFNDKAVQAEVTYVYRVISLTDSERSDETLSSQVEGYALAKQTSTKPSRVLGLTGAPRTKRKGYGIDLDWSKSQDAQYYQVIRYHAKKRRWYYLAKRNKDNSYNDRQPMKGYANVYAVRGVNSKGQGKWSKVVRVELGNKKTPPSVVSGLKASYIYNDKIVLNWNNTPGAGQYHLYRYDYDSKKWLDPVSTKATSYSDTNSLKSGKSYVYTVIASNAQGRSSKYSDYAYGMIRTASRSIANIAAIKNLTATVSQKDDRANVSLKWEKSKDAKAYNVYVKKQAGNFKFVTTSKTNSIVVTLPGEAGELYYYSVKAQGELGESENSNVISAFINAKPIVMRSRSLADAGIDKFIGQWSTLRFDHKMQPLPLNIKVSRDKETDLVVSIDYAGKKKISKVKFISNSMIIENEFFNMNLNTGLDGTANLEFFKTNKSKLEFKTVVTKDEA